MVGEFTPWRCRHWVIKHLSPHHCLPPPRGREVEMGIVYLHHNCTSQEAISILLSIQLLVGVWCGDYGKVSSTEIEPSLSISVGGRQLAPIIRASRLFIIPTYHFYCTYTP
jgi:hypothetical protein